MGRPLPTDANTTTGGSTNNDGAPVMDGIEFGDHDAHPTRGRHQDTSAGPGHDPGVVRIEDG